jgi:hypothetical protein
MDFVLGRLSDLGATKNTLYLFFIEELVNALVDKKKSAAVLDKSEQSLLSLVIKRTP